MHRIHFFDNCTLRTPFRKHHNIALSLDDASVGERSESHDNKGDAHNSSDCPTPTLNSKQEQEQEQILTGSAASCVPCEPEASLLTVFVILE